MPSLHSSEGPHRAATALHDAALDTTLVLVDGIPDGAWGAPTPCAHWTVRDIVGHLAWGNGVLAAAVRGSVYREPTGGLRTIVLPPPIPVAYRATVEEVRNALRSSAPDTVAFPTGTVPTTAAVGIRVMDLGCTPGISRSRSG